MNFIIRNAEVFDGTGSDAQANTDVWVRDGQIAAVGPEIDAPDAEVIDATGLSLMPGIIDTHTHFDAQVTWDPTVRPSPALGVTTVVMGNCGFTIAPCKEADRDIVVLDGHLVKIVAWYDNEWGFANRMIDVSRMMCNQKKI